METNLANGFSQPFWLDTLEDYSTLDNNDRFELANQSIDSSYLEFIPHSDSSTESAIRINVGGKEYIDVFGNAWQADKYFSSDSHQFSRPVEIASTDLEPIYQTERFSQNLSYAVPLENNRYDIKLHFAEIYFTGTNKRVFDVSVEDNLISNDLDLVAQVGTKEALAIALDNIVVADGILNLDLNASIDNAKLSGIEIIPSKASKTIRINAGGSEYTDERGQIWQADNYFDSSSYSFSKEMAIENTVEDTLFQTERFGKQLAYDIPVDNGTYDINLHFAEIYFADENRRVFDVAVESELVKDNLDIVAEAGKANSLTVGLKNVAISDGKLDLDLIASIDNAKISGIEIIPVLNPAPIIELDLAQLEANDGAIERPTNFAGRVIDDDLEFYRVEIAPVGLLDLNNLAAADADYMSIDAVTGNVPADTLFTIDPSLYNKGSYYARVYARDSSGNISFEGLFLEIDDPAGIYVSANGVANGIGTKDSPVATLKDACKLLENHSNLNTIYVREGVYTNPGYGNGELNNKSMGAITCSGTSEEHLTIRPYGKEKVKFAFDSFNGIRLKGNYINFQGFEVEGAAQDISYEEALADWWTAPGSKKYNGNGIVINGHHINVRDNIVHDTPGSAIFINNGGDHSHITDNIIYNAAWWSTKGTTAIGMINARNSDDLVDQQITGSACSRIGDSGVTPVTAQRNLIFASESRIFSRVPSKGFAELAIDEGSGTLVQVNDQNYTGDYLIKDNFYLYNGKGIAIARTDNATVENNTLYLNGSTINGKSTGLRLNGGKNINFVNNAVVVDPEDNAYSVAKENKESFVTSHNNYLVGGDKIADLPPGNNLVSKIFTDPDNFDFSLLELGNLTDIPSNVGAPISVFNRLKKKADEYGIKIAPSNWVMDYEAQTKAIVESAPVGSIYDVWEDDKILDSRINVVDWSQHLEKVIVHLPEGQDFQGNTEFELRIKTPYKLEDSGLAEEQRED